MQTARIPHHKSKIGKVGRGDAASMTGERSGTDGRGALKGRHDMTATGLVTGSDGRPRCFWGAGSPEYTAYHDDEWGRPVRTDDALFERMTLEAFQSGLAWITILRKREAFRRAFDGFSIAKVAAYAEADADRLLADPGIVRNRMKIDAALHNARVAADLPDGLARLLWSFAP